MRSEFVLVTADNWIEEIRFLRARYGCGLTHTKDFVTQVLGENAEEEKTRLSILAILNEASLRRETKQAVMEAVSDKINEPTKS